MIEGQDQFGSIRSVIMICIVLMVLTVGVYWQVGGHEFLNYDDNDYITENPHMASGLTVANIVWAFSALEECNWHPVTWLSHLADAQLYGMNPRGHYLTNVAFHTVSTLILFFFFFRFSSSLWQSFFVAALFAVHPLHVESVAWLAERKDVLSALFCFLTLYVYGIYAKNKNKRLYVLAIFLFMLGLMSKSMLVTLPVILLLMDFWPLKRMIPSARNDGTTTPIVNVNFISGFLDWVVPLLKEKLPFFILSLLTSGITVYAQQKGGAVSSLNAVPVLLRIENAFVSYIRYIIKTFWPQNMAIIYPYPVSIPLWQVACSLLFLLFGSSHKSVHGSRHG
ncbi:MAG: hypothetical protein PHI31_15635 [Desulfuromonadaceae bacterium]|nr:hypothetical protein [Desulfuromonadaceae bacterium]